MHYETRMLPLDDDGNFLVAVHHGMHKVGGEDQRETHHARFAVGHVDRPGELRDITALCTPTRPASGPEADYHRQMAEGQGELAHSTKGPMAASYACNQARMIHSAELARIDGVHVPRRAFASRNGRVLLAYETHNIGPFPRLWASIRLIDAAAHTVLLEESSTRLPDQGMALGSQMLEMLEDQIEEARAHCGADELDALVQMLEAARAESKRRDAPDHRLLATQIGRTLALSADGSRILTHAEPGPAKRLVECRLEKGLPESARLAPSQYLAVRSGWLAVNAAGDSMLPWAAAAAFDSGALVVPGENGAVWLLEAPGAKPRRFNPHRGLKRGTYVDVAISDCGRWIASRAGAEIAVTRLHDGVSWPVATVEDRMHEDTSWGDYVVSSYVPGAFAFIGTRLFVVQDGKPYEVALGDPGAKAIVSELGRAGAHVPINIPANVSLDRMLQAARLEPAAEEISRHLSPALTMKTKPLGKAGWARPGEGNAPALGTSRIGGWPDVAPGTAWPLWQRRPMAFLAQVNLAEAHAAEPRIRLPREGLLSFFMGCEKITYEKDDDPRQRHMVDLMAGTEAQGRDAWRVVLTRDVANLQRLLYEGSPLPQLFSPCAVKLARGGLPLPDENTIAYEQLRLDESQRERYNELLTQLAPSDGHELEQLMGYPQLIQSTPPEIMCERSARGEDPWTLPQMPSREFESLAAAAAEWGLLLQLTSNGDADFEWGDAGHLYFYGHRAAMEQGDFSSVWVNYECH